MYHKKHHRYDGKSRKRLLIGKYLDWSASNYYIMTLSELLHSVTFDDIIPFIRNFEDGNRCIALYKMHYDYLYHLTPTKNGGEIKKATVSCIPADDYYESRFYAYPLNEDRWEDSVAKELII